VDEQTGDDEKTKAACGRQPSSRLTRSLLVLYYGMTNMSATRPALETKQRRTGLHVAWRIVMQIQLL